MMAHSVIAHRDGWTEGINIIYSKMGEFGRAKEYYDA